MLVVGSDILEINKMKEQLSREFKMKEMGASQQNLGMSIIRNRVTGTVKLS